MFISTYVTVGKPRSLDLVDLHDAMRKAQQLNDWHFQDETRVGVDTFTIIVTVTSYCKA